MCRKIGPWLEVDQPFDRARDNVERAAQKIRWDLKKLRWFGTELTFRPGPSSQAGVSGSLRVTLVRKTADKTRMRITARALTPRRAVRALKLLTDALDKPGDPSTKRSRRTEVIERRTVRVATVALLAVAVAAAIILSTPTKCIAPNLTQHGPICAKGKIIVDDLPAPAFGQAVIYHVEIAVLVLFAGLLIAAPAISGIFRGEMPLEISTEGVRFGEPALLADDQLQESVEKIGSRLSVIEPIVSELRLRMEQSEGDNRAS